MKPVFDVIPFDGTLSHFLIFLDNEGLRRFKRQSHLSTIEGRDSLAPHPIGEFRIDQGSIHIKRDIFGHPLTLVLKDIGASGYQIIAIRISERIIAK
jgi:hypothetical protein